VDARVDPNTRNVLLRAKLDEVEGLLPGMFAILEVDLGDQQQLVTIPETAMTYSLRGNTVWVIEEAEDDGLTATARVVVGGPVREGRVAVLEGLQAGEKVVSVGQNKLYRGVRVLVDEDLNL
jgi:membrane fusion protein (multidrug efflux system)